MGTSVAPTLWSPAMHALIGAVRPMLVSDQPRALGSEQQDVRQWKFGRSEFSNSLMKIVKLCLQCCLVFPNGNHLGVVKPHGRLGPLRLEWVAPGPRAAYRRGGLPRPFKRLKASGEFILGRASHLDAFSGYHSRSSLPGGAPGGTTGTRAGRPTRSSRTRVRSPQHSNAHDGYRPNCLTTF